MVGSAFRSPISYHIFWSLYPAGVFSDPFFIYKYNSSVAPTKAIIRPNSINPNKFHKIHFYGGGYRSAGAMEVRFLTQGAA